RRTQSLRQPRASGERPLRERRRHLLRGRHTPGETHQGALRLVRHHADVGALGTGLLPRCRKNVGDELDHGFPESAVKIARALLAGVPALVLTAAPLLPAAAPLLEPGSPGVDASAIAPYSNLFDVFEVQ